MNLDLTVVIPARNAANYLRETLQSVILQEHRATGIIVVNDGSTDGTAQVAKEFQHHGLRVVDGPARGAAAALNSGIAEAPTELIAHFDADDLMLPSKLRKQLEPFSRAKASQLGLVASDLQMFDESGCDPITFLDRRSHFRQQQPRYTEDGIVWLPVNEGFGLVCREHCIDVKGIYRKSAWAKIGGFDQSLRCAYDMDFVWRVAKQFDIAVIPDVLFRGRRHAENLSGGAELVSKECIRVFQRMRRHSRTPDENQYLKQRIAAERNDLSYISWKAGHPRRAIQNRVLALLQR